MSEEKLEDNLLVPSRIPHRYHNDKTTKYISPREKGKEEENMICQMLIENWTIKKMLSNPGVWEIYIYIYNVFIYSYI